MSEQDRQNTTSSEHDSSASGDEQTGRSERTAGGKQKSGGTSWTERIEVASAEALETIKSLIREGNVRRVTIKNSNGRELLSLPVTAGAAIGGVAVLAVPTVAAIAAFTALLTQVTLEIERTDEKEEPHEGDSIVSAEVVDESDQ